MKAVLLIAVALVAAYVFYDFNGNSFDPSDRQVLLIVTDSMDGDVEGFDIDSFPRNTYIMIQKLDQDEIVEKVEVGDVLSFRQGDKLNHHRVIETHFDEGYVVTKGDNAPLPETVKLEKINGEVIGANHWLGSVASEMKEHYIAVLFILFIIVSADYAWSVIKRDKEKQKENDRYEFNS